MEIYEEVKVSVFTITFNHENFIGECLESVLSQKTNFKFEIIIGEDCSSDNTPHIIEYYRNKYPFIIKAVHRNKNIGANRNFIDTLSRCNGKYIVYLDGDDYILPGKLQKQFDFMESNPEYSMCGHNIRILDNNKKKTMGYYNQKLKLFKGTIDDFARLGTYIGAASIMYRKDFVDLKLYTSLNRYLFQGDWLLHMIVSRNGFVGYIDEVLSVYRKHDDGITYASKKDIDKRKKLLTEQLDILDNAILLGASEESVERGKARLLYLVSRDMLTFGDMKEFKKYITQAGKLFPPVSVKEKIIYKLRNFPNLLRILNRINNLRKKF